MSKRISRDNGREGGEGWEEKLYLSVRTVNS